MSHSSVVWELYNQLHLLCERDLTYWDGVRKEVSYFEKDTCPIGASPSPKGREVGEFDLILVNFDDRNGYYFEVKTNSDYISQGYKQVERAKSFFPGTLTDKSDWAIIGDVFLEEE